MTKRDDDAPADMEVGMTTAERRRRRRRGGGLRVPSDNVPRRTTTPPVVAPVPEDPSLAMSIAYSFTNDGSEPVQRIDEPEDAQVAASFAEPIAPESATTMIDPMSPPPTHEGVDFEMKTREMSAVDLQALGLDEPGSKMERVSSPGLAPPIIAPHAAVTEPAITFKTRNATEPSIAPPDVGVDSSDVEVDMDVDVTEGPGSLDIEPPTSMRMTDPSNAIPHSAVEDSFEPPPEMPIHTVKTGPVNQSRTGTRERLKTVALSEEDIEVVREAVRQITQGDAHKVAINSTQPLTALDVEVMSHADAAKPKPSLAEQGSAPEIDLNDLMGRSAESGEFEVDVDDKDEAKHDDKLTSVPQAAAVTPPPPTPPVASAPGPRARPPSVPPPMNTDRVPKQTPDPDNLPAKAKDAHAPPPPPPAATHKAPPAPPPKAKEAKAAAQAATAAKVEGKGSRGKPWFVDLFDEDYLRTLPFLTPQATQSEAEFVIDALGLSAGAQVLDVGCGYGRHAMELAARGFHVVGLDLSTPLLVRGGEEAMRRGLEINFVRGDMRELDFDSQFDGAYCMFSTFGYFDDETNKKTVANIARALKPGGRVLIEILNRDYVIADLPTRVWWEGEGCVVLEEVELNYFSSRIQVNRSVVFDDGRQLEQEISVRAYSLHEVGKLMHAAGFRVLEVSGGYHTRGRFFGNQSRHIIVLAERKDPAAP